MLFFCDWWLYQSTVRWWWVFPHRTIVNCWWFGHWSKYVCGTWSFFKK